MAQITVTSHRVEVIDAKNEQVKAALEDIGGMMERYAKMLCPVDTSRLRGSIAHDADETTAVVGTNVEYAPYLEFGTGQFAEGGGRATPWRYQDDKGEWHTTSGNKPQPFLRPSVDNHIDEYKGIIQEHLQG